MKDVRRLFGGLVKNPEQLEKAEFPLCERQSRLLVVATMQDAALLTDDLYNTISDLPPVQAIWSIESLAPVPFLSASADDVTKRNAEDLIGWLNKHSLRGVFAMSEVMFGTIGRGTRFANGSVSSDVPHLLAGAFNLDCAFSWCTHNVAELLGRNSEDMMRNESRGTVFYRL